MAETMKLWEVVERTAARAEANSKAIGMIARELETAAPGTVDRLVERLDAIGSGDTSTPVRAEEFARLVRIITSP